MNYFSFRRGWWKPWDWSTRAWVLAICVLALVSPLLTRWFFLWQVPDVTLPFNVEDVVQREILKDDDAMVRYASALLSDRFEGGFTPDENSFHSMVEFYEAEEEAVAKPDRKWDKRFDTWLLSKKVALDEYRLASEMRYASGPSLKSADVNTMVGVHQDSRKLVRLASLEAIRQERMGEFDVAWNWHLANLRFARHCQMPRYLICHLIGIGARSYAYRGIARWAEHASLSSDQLQVARQELLTDRDMSIPNSELIKSEYLILKNSMKLAEMPNHLLTFWRFAAPELPLILAGKRIVLWTIGQPEVVLRLARQELVNNLEQIDVPPHLRCQSDSYKYEVVFQTDQRARRIRGQLDSARLLATIETDLEKLTGLEGRLLGARNIDRANRADAARRCALDVALAAHQYQRRHGEFPATIEQLVPEYLETIPFDPMSEIGVSIHYRRAETGEAIVWSIGYDGIDDGGDILGLKPKDIGFQIRLNRQGAAKPEDQSQE
jgi:hypothetical protein